MYVISKGLEAGWKSNRVRNQVASCIPGHPAVICTEHARTPASGLANDSARVFSMHRVHVRVRRATDIDELIAGGSVALRD